MMPTEEYIQKLSALKQGELARLRRLADRPLDADLEGFDLFSGLWWPLREKSAQAPRREVAWLVAKLYAACRVPHEHDADNCFAVQAGRLRQSCKTGDGERKRFADCFDRLLRAPLVAIEPWLREMLGKICQTTDNPKLDWVKLTDDLSAWERETTRERWAEEFMGMKGKTNVD